MFVFPHAGGSILSYAFLKTLPGLRIFFMGLNFDRNVRISNYSELLNQFKNDIDRLWMPEEEAIFLGISLGGQIAYDLVKIFENTANRLVAKLIVVSSSFISKNRRFLSMAAQNVQNLRKFLVSIGSSVDILNDAHSTASLMADLTLLYSRPNPKNEKIKASILLIIGREDKEACKQKIYWETATYNFKCSMFHGGHLFFLKNPCLLFNEILKNIPLQKECKL